MKRSDLCVTNRYVIKEVIGGSDITPSFGRNLEFTLADVPQVSDIQNMFDKYQFYKIQYRFVVNRNPDYANAQKGFAVRIMHVIDHDASANDVAPANFAEIQAYQNCKEIWLNDNKVVSRWYSLRPNTLALAYAGATSDYKHDYRAWLDTARTGAKHYGVRLFGDSLYAGISVLIECRYHMKLKGVH